jgi:peptidase A4-like protein
VRTLQTRVVSLALLALASNGAAAAANSQNMHTYSGRPIVSVGANRSNNWSGYNQGTLEQGGKLFSSISGTWTVPTASAHKANEAEYSASWIGIGGGCVDASCTVTDSTLIQDGTEQDVDASGKASYDAWWELIPAPSVLLSGCTPDPNCTVAAGNRMSRTIATTTPGVWTMSMRNATRGWTWRITVPYSSTEATAEWIEETPVVIDNSGNLTVGPMPKLSTVHFDLALTDGANPRLKASEEIQLVDFYNKVIATPSAPDVDTDGFNDCTYATSCRAPGSS